MIPDDNDSQNPSSTFTLRHIFHHGTYSHPRLHRKQNVDASTATVFLPASDGYDRQELPPLIVKRHSTKIERLVDRRPSVVDPLVAASRRRGGGSPDLSIFSSPSAWSLDDVPAPDVTDKETILNLAYIASNAYVADEDGDEWEEVGGHYNRSADFGWEADGLRGHIWSDEDNTTVIMGLKGTSPAVFDGEGTTTNDKINDNLFFSCCCAQQGPWSWHQVCDCATATYQCNNTCVVASLHEEHRYYTAAKELYSNVTELYPDADIWITGHSLGGAVASLLGLTYGLPVVTFEAVPEALPAHRLGLPSPPGTDPRLPQTRKYAGVWHFGHTADPVYIGTCNGATATCTYAGYAMESTCHSGMECVYDVVADKGWRVGIGTHKIRSVIHDVIMKYDEVPKCRYTPECRDCANWKMFESNGTEHTTTSASATSTTTTTIATLTTSSLTTTSAPRTRTATCQTPGWWGCLDSTTTPPVTSPPSSSSSSSTSTCLTPGWFGCKDKTTTESVTTTEPPAPTTTCETPGHFWGCLDEPTSTTPATTPATPTPTSSFPLPRRRCLRRTWLGKCTEWRDDEAADL